MKKILFIFVALLCANLLLAQKHLNKTITVDISKQSLKKSLTIISDKGDFNFSYNSKSIPQDSIVSIYAENKQVLSVLRTVFDATYDFKEVGSYVIIRRKKINTKNVIAKRPSVNEVYYLTGFVVNEATGEKIADATIYETMNLLSVMSDENGYFSLKLKKKYRSAEISVSKEHYLDTTISIKRNHNQKLIVALEEKAPAYEIIETTSDNTGGIVTAANNASDELFQVEGNWLGRIFVSSKQKVQSLNLRRFYTTRTWQLSAIQPYSTHGRMNAQVVNRVSINVFGGYSGGTDLFELGGLYNINKKNVKYFQAAGLFNNVGGNVQGFQIAGLLNLVEDSVKGLQTAGLASVTKEHVRGIQFSGLINNAKSVEGAQLSGLANVTKSHVQGGQCAGLFNKAGSISGLQIGLVNVVTDENTGSSFGLINISKGKNGRKRIGFIYRAPRNN